MITASLKEEIPNENWNRLKSIVGASVLQKEKALSAVGGAGALPERVRRREQLLFQEAIGRIREVHDENMRKAMAEVARSNNEAGRFPAMAHAFEELMEASVDAHLTSLVEAVRFFGLRISPYRSEISSLLALTAKTIADTASSEIDRRASATLNRVGSPAAVTKVRGKVASVLASAERRLELLEQEDSLKSDDVEKPSYRTFLDDYEVVRQIGQGGCGRVFEVRNSDGLRLALKELGPTKVSTLQLKRFKQEALFFQADHHPNLIRVTDVGISRPENAPFYVMPLFPDTFRSLMKKTTPEALLRLYRQVLDGVEKIHSLGIFHRDLKPENLLYDPATDLAVVADFGIAHFAEELLLTSIETGSHDRNANFVYAAPEQRSRNGVVDHRADIFALGSILNELFTGVPVHGPGYPRIGVSNAAYSHLDPLVETMVQHNPDARPSSIEEVKRALDADRLNAA